MVSRTQTQAQPLQHTYVQSFVNHMLFSCVVFFLCNPLFGLIAFILAGSLNYTQCSPRRSSVLKIYCVYQHTVLCSPDSLLREQKTVMFFFILFLARDGI